MANTTKMIQALESEIAARRREAKMEIESALGDLQRALDRLNQPAESLGSVTFLDHLGHNVGNRCHAVSVTAGRIDSAQGCLRMILETK